MSAKINRSTFLRLMGLTGSSADPEALAALRRAQKMLSAAGLMWSDVIGIPAEHTALPSQRLEFAGEAYFPPIGNTWRETIVFLASKMAGRYPAEQLWLDRLAARQQEIGDVPAIDGADAAQLVAIHQTHPVKIA
jgi:hypothetical protein